MKLLKSMAIILVVAHASQTSASAKAEHSYPGESREMETSVYVAWQGQQGHTYGYHNITVPVKERRVQAVAIKAALTRMLNYDFSLHSVLFRHDLVADQGNVLESSILANDLEKNETKIDYPTVFTMTSEIQSRYENAQRAREESRKAKAHLMHGIINGRLQTSASASSSSSPVSSIATTRHSSVRSARSSSSSSSVPMVTTFDDVE